MFSPNTCWYWAIGSRPFVVRLNSRYIGAKSSVCNRHRNQCINLLKICWWYWAIGSSPFVMQLNSWYIRAKSSVCNGHRYHCKHLLILSPPAHVYTSYPLTILIWRFTYTNHKTVMRTCGSGLMHRMFMDTQSCDVHLLMPALLSYHTELCLVGYPSFFLVRVFQRFLRHHKVAGSQSWQHLFARFEAAMHPERSQAWSSLPIVSLWVRGASIQRAEPLCGVDLWVLGVYVCSQTGVTDPIKQYEHLMAFVNHFCARRIFAFGPCCMLNLYSSGSQTSTHSSPDNALTANLV